MSDMSKVVRDVDIVFTVEFVVDELFCELLCAVLLADFELPVLPALFSVALSSERHDVNGIVKTNTTIMHVRRMEIGIFIKLAPVSNKPL